MREEDAREGLAHVCAYVSSQNIGQMVKVGLATLKLNE